MFDVTKEIPLDKDGIVKPNYTVRAFESRGMLALQGRGGMRGTGEIREDFIVTKESAPIVVELIESFFPKLTRGNYSKDRVLFREKLHPISKFVNACVTVAAPRDYTIKTKDGEKEIHDDNVQITHPDNSMDVMNQDEFLSKYEPVNNSAKELVEKYFSRTRLPR